MAKRIARLVVAGAMSALVMSGLSAQVAAADPPCYEGQVCVYRNGALLSRFAPMYSGQCKTLPTYYDRIWNRSAIVQRTWYNTGCTGGNLLVQQGENKYIFSVSVGGY
ncbi:hypothetical protein GCM10009789_74180 [Kribbella sancticallisti]|uniref:Peptidase inhibitor family I36 n=1 Tax=Kribbella sancticallisti TaxID=460087 RepID=A0ABP4QEB5_9ACTN